MTKTKPRAGATVLSLANALEAVSQVMTAGHERRGGDWEGGRLTDPDCIDKCNDSMTRHFLAEGRGELIDDGEDGTGYLHAACTAANALIKLERMLRDGETADASPSNDEICTHGYGRNSFYCPSCRH